MLTDYLTARSFGRSLPRVLARVNDAAPNPSPASLPITVSGRRWEEGGKKGFKSEVSVHFEAALGKGEDCVTVGCCAAVLKVSKVMIITAGWVPRYAEEIYPSDHEGLG